MSQIHQHRYENGLTLLVEPMKNVKSAAMTLLLPAGAATEPADQLGVTQVLGEMLFRGAGDLDARQHSDALDRLGVHRSYDVQTHHLRLGATMLGDRLARALPLLTDMIRRPHLADKAFEPAAALAMQGLAALEDEPQQKVMVELKRHHLPEPLNHPQPGVAEQVQNLTLEQVRQHCDRHFVPDGSILALAGDVDFEAVREQVGRLLGDWGGAVEPLAVEPAAERGYHHITAETAQAHIGLAFDTVGEADPLNMQQRLAVAVLSGGMSGRLFTEVREKRGLCYAVYAAYAPQPTFGTVYAYAGTTVARAAETLEVLRQELERVNEGVEREEFDRAVVGLKARLVMQGESTGARAKAIAGDQFLVGRPRTLDEREAAVDAVTLDMLNEYLASHPPERFTTLTIGPERLG